MCIACGCGNAASHHHGHDHDHPHHDSPLGAAHAPGLDSARTLKIEENLLAANDEFAAQNRALFASHKILALNLVSSPGSGKTTLLAQTLAEKRFPAAVIEGDQSTDLDAARLRAVGATAIQINTGRGCHLDAHMVRHALEDLRLDSGNLNGSVVLIENVGNLVCPAAFDLGEAAKVVLLSVTEGEDKPLKYPDMFRAARLMILTKADLLPHVKFDVDSCIAHARNINPSIEALVLSSTSGSGMNEWFSWLEKARRHGG